MTALAGMGKVYVPWPVLVRETGLPPSPVTVKAGQLVACAGGSRQGDGVSLLALVGFAVSVPFTMSPMVI